METDVEIQGRLAYLGGIPRLANPFPEQTDNWRHWLKGWDAQEKMKKYFPK